MNSQQFLTLNIVILVIFVLWFLMGRRGVPKNTALKMKEGNRTPGGVLQAGPAETKIPVAKIPNPSETTSSGRYSHPRFQKFLETPEVTGSKNLNVLFNYNGHTWDAYEVLGVPAGVGLVEVTRAYQELVKKSDPESYEFLETAFKTILEKK